MTELISGNIWKLIANEYQDQSILKESLDLFCIGTIADMAPLIGANRKWLKECLPKINTTNNIGIKSILKKLEFDDHEINSDDIGYKIAPLINAVGRIANPDLILTLFTEEDPNKSMDIARRCDVINRQRFRK